MNDPAKRRRGSASGFTLIELQVAMALLVVLARTSLMFVTGTTGRPRLYRWHTDGVKGGSWGR